MSNREKISAPGESSKRAGKRARMQKQADMVSIIEVRNQGVRISNGSSNIPSNVSSQGVADATKAQKKKTRGKTRLKVAEGKQLIELEWNEYGQPIGPNSAELSTYLGVLVRENVPLTLDSWPKLPKDTKDALWKRAKQRYRLEDWNKRPTIRHMGKLWRDNKSRLSIALRKRPENMDAVCHYALIKPDCVSSAEWGEFVKQRSSTKFQEKSKKFREMRAKKTFNHTMSRMGYARLADNLRKESPNPEAITRAVVWTHGHTKKNGEPINEAVEETMKKISEEHCGSQPTINLREDALACVLGPERRGQVRGLGFGVTPSKVEAQVQQHGTVKQLQNEVHDLRNQINELKTMFFQGMRQNGNGCPEDMMDIPGATVHSEHDSTSTERGDDLVNAYCKLVNWMGTGEVVAEGQIASIDPNTLVHHVPLGPGCWKVLVNLIIKDVPLFRPTREFFYLSRSLGSTIAWPAQFVSLDD